MTLFNSTKKHFEGVLSDLTGADIEIDVKVKSFPVQPFIDDCDAILNMVKEKTAGKDLTKKIDPYYLALQLAIIKHPHLKPKHFAIGFKKSRQGIENAIKEIKNAMDRDDKFYAALHELKSFAGLQM